MRMSNSAATAQPHSPHHVPRRLEGTENTCRKSAGARARCSLSAWLRLDENDLVAAEEELSGIIHLFLPPQPPRQSRWIGIPLFPLATLASREHFFIRSTDRTKIQGQLPCPKNVYLLKNLSIRPPRRLLPRNTQRRILKRRHQRCHRG